MKRCRPVATSVIRNSKLDGIHKKLLSCSGGFFQRFLFASLCIVAGKRPERLIKGSDLWTLCPPEQWFIHPKAHRKEPVPCDVARAGIRGVTVVSLRVTPVAISIAMTSDFFIKTTKYTKLKYYIFIPSW